MLVVLESFGLGVVVISVSLLKNSSIIVCDTAFEVVLRAVFLILVLFLVASKSHAPTENVCGMDSILGGFAG